MGLLGLFLVLLVPAFGQKDCPNAPANPQDRRTDKTKLKLGTFNAEWLFPGNDPYSPRTIAQADQHLLDVAGAIAAFNPDMLTIEEVANCTMLVRLIDVLKTRHNIQGLVPYMVAGTDTATGQNVGLITRIDPSSNLWRTANRWNYPIPNSKCGYTGSSGTTGVSKHYIANFKINGVSVAMLGLHFLAFPTDPSRCVQREGQASVMRSMINNEMTNNQEIIILGDWNDYSYDVKDSANDVPTSRVMHIVKNGLVNSGLADFGFDNSSGEVSPSMLKPMTTAIPPTLHEPSQRAPQAQRYTSIYDGNKVSMIDHILVSERISNAITSITFDHAYAAYTVSDHWPVWISINTPF
jgi:hypothetical protein